MADQNITQKSQATTLTADAALYAVNDQAGTPTDVHIERSDLMQYGRDNPAFIFDSTTTEGDPGAGKFRANNADITLATELYGSNTTNDGLDFSAIVNTMADGSLIRMQHAGQPERSVMFRVSAAAENFGTWSKVVVTYIDHTGVVPANGDLMVGNFYPVIAPQFNGTVIERQDTTVVVDTGQVYLDVELKGGGNLPVQLGDIIYHLDCTTGSGVGGKARSPALTQGTATTLAFNIVWCQLNAGVPTLYAGSPASVPTDGTPYAYVAYVSIQDAASVTTNGPLLHQRTTDAFTHDGRGRISYIDERIRAIGAQWASQVQQTLTITTNAGVPDNVDVTTTAGGVYQLHRQTFPARQVTVDGCYVANASGLGTLTKYQKITDLNAVLEDTQGASLSGSRFNLVIFGVVNKTTSECQLFVNLPTDGYLANSSCYSDIDNTAVTSVPSELRSVAFLICRIPLRHQTTGGGTWTSVGAVLGRPEVIDLRGTVIGGSGQGAAPSSSSFADNVFELFSNADPSKLGDFDLSGITTGTERTLTWPNKDGTIATLADIVGPEFSDATFEIQDNADATKVGKFESSGITTGTTRTFTFPDKDGTIATTADIVGPEFSDATFEIQDNTDNTKVGKFEASGITTGTTRTYTFPDKNGTIAMTSDITGGGGLSWSVISTNTTATADNGYMINAGSGAITLTLPATPSAGDTVGVKSLYATNTITVARNGSNIEGAAENLEIDIDGAGIQLVYSDATKGWVNVTEAAGLVEVGGAAGSGGFNWTTTDDDELSGNATATIDHRHTYPNTVSASYTLTLPAIGATNDGKYVAFSNDSKYEHYIAANGTDQIGWPQLEIGEIECLPDTFVILRADNTKSKWEIVHKTGSGQVRPKGTVFYVTKPHIGLAATGATTNGEISDATNRHLMTTYGNLSVNASSKGTAFGNCIEMDGTGDYGLLADSDDWNIFGSTTGDCTLSGWVYFDNTASGLEILFSQYEDLSNRWHLYRNGSGAWTVLKATGGTADINENAGTAAATTWYHFALCRVGSDVGLYIDGSQILYDGAWTGDNYATGLYVGQFGNNGDYLDGRMDDISIVFQNIYGAAPVAGLTDSISIDTLNPLGLIL